jgi:hypothetical protein
MTARGRKAITCYYHGGQRDGTVEVLPRSEVSRVRCFPVRTTPHYTPDAQMDPGSVVTASDLIYRRTGPIIDFIAHYANL